MKTRHSNTQMETVKLDGGCCGATPVEVQPVQSSCCGTTPEVEEKPKEGGCC